jgi:hypothetical protein
MTEFSTAADVTARFQVIFDRMKETSSEQSEVAEKAAEDSRTMQIIASLSEALDDPPYVQTFMTA